MTYFEKLHKVGFVVVASSENTISRSPEVDVVKVVGLHHALARGPYIPLLPLGEVVATQRSKRHRERHQEQRDGFGGLCMARGARALRVCECRDFRRFRRAIAEVRVVCAAKWVSCDALVRQRQRLRMASLGFCGRSRGRVNMHMPSRVREKPLLRRNIMLFRIMS